MKLKYALTGLLVLYLVAMFMLAILPHLGFIKGVSENDKILHLTEFFVFTILLIATLSFYDIKDMYLIATVSVLSIILISELIQIPVVGRTFSLQDIIADMTGSAAAFFVMFLARLRWKSSKQ